MIRVQPIDVYQYWWKKLNQLNAKTRLIPNSIYLLQPTRSQKMNLPIELLHRSGTLYGIQRETKKISRKGPYISLTAKVRPCRESCGGVAEPSGGGGARSSNFSMKAPKSSFPSISRSLLPPASSLPAQSARSSSYPLSVAKRALWPAQLTAVHRHRSQLWGRGRGWYPRLR